MLHSKLNVEVEAEADDELRQSLNDAFPSCNTKTNSPKSSKTEPERRLTNTWTTPMPLRRQLLELKADGRNSLKEQERPLQQKTDQCRSHSTLGKATTPRSGTWNLEDLRFKRADNILAENNTLSAKTKVEGFRRQAPKESAALKQRYLASTLIWIPRAQT